MSAPCPICGSPDVQILLDGSVHCHGCTYEWPAANPPRDDDYGGDYLDDYDPDYEGEEIGDCGSPPGDGSYACGSEQCDWCRFSDECHKVMMAAHRRETRLRRREEERP